MTGSRTGPALPAQRVAEPSTPGDRFAAVFLGLPDAVLLCDREGRVVEANPGAEALFGRPVATLLGGLPGDPEAGRHSQAQVASVRAHLTAHPSWTGDLPFLRGDGERRVGRTTWTALPTAADDDGEPCYLVVTRDVTDEAVTSVMLAEAELRWRLTLDAAPIGIALVGLDGQFVRVNAALADIVGHTEPELLGRGFQALTHTADLDGLLEQMAQLLREEIDRFTVELRLLHVTGRPVWVRVAVALVWREGGDPLHYILQVEDVTAARRSHRRLAAIIDGAHDAYISIDRTGAVTEWNPAAEAMFGWGRREALGRRLSDLIMSPGMASAHTAGMARLAGGGQPVVLGQRLELTALRRDGSEFPVELSVWRSEDDSEEFHAFLRDISDRVRAEARARAHTARQHAIVQAQLDIAQVELTPSKVMQRICDQAATVTGAEGALIALLDGSDLVYRSTSASKWEHLGLRLPVEGSFSGLVATTGQILATADAEHDPRVDPELARRLDLRSMIAAPLRHGGAVVGVLKVIHSAPGRFGDDDAGTLELLAVPFATAMGNAWQLEETSHQALSDPMTGLANRAYALHELERSLARQDRHGGHTAVVFVDLDGFKAVNDRWGHAAGDELLGVVAERLRQAVRTTDTPARYGGDEFVIVCERLTMPEDAHILAERLVSGIPGDYPLEAGTATIGASIGVAVAAGPVSAARLLRLADEAMYEAKQAGGCGYRIRSLG